MNKQLNFDFSPPRENKTSPPRLQSDQKQQDGIDRWRAEHRARMEALARKQGLPLGHKARVELKSGHFCEGLLLLNEEHLFLPQRRDPHLSLRIGSNCFHADEIESCVRID